MEKISNFKNKNLNISQTVDLTLGNQNICINEDNKNNNNLFLQQLNKENINKEKDGSNLMSDILKSKNDVIHDYPNSGCLRNPEISEKLSLSRQSNISREYKEIPDSNLWCIVNQNSEIINSLPPNVNLLPNIPSHLEQNSFSNGGKEFDNCISSQDYNTFNFKYNEENSSSPMSPNSILLYNNRLDNYQHIPTENLHVTKYTVHHVPTSNVHQDFNLADKELSNAVIKEQILKLGVPKKPLSPYMSFSKMVWPKVKEMCPGVGVGTVGATIGQLWRELDGNLKKQMVDSYLYEKKLYDANIAEYVKMTGIQPMEIKKYRSQNINLSEKTSQLSNLSNGFLHQSTENIIPKQARNTKKNNSKIVTNKKGMNKIELEDLNKFNSESVSLNNNPINLNSYQVTNNNIKNAIQVINPFESNLVLQQSNYCDKIKNNLFIQKDSSLQNYSENELQLYKEALNSINQSNRSIINHCMPINSLDSFENSNNAYQIMKNENWNIGIEDPKILNHEMKSSISVKNSGDIQKKEINSNNGAKLPHFSQVWNNISSPLSAPPEDIEEQITIRTGLKRPSDAQLNGVNVKKFQSSPLSTSLSNPLLQNQSIHSPLTPLPSPVPFGIKIEKEYLEQNRNVDALIEEVRITRKLLDERTLQVDSLYAELQQAANFIGQFQCLFQMLHNSQNDTNLVNEINFNYNIDSIDPNHNEKYNQNGNYGHLNGNLSKNDLHNGQNCNFNGQNISHSNQHPIEDIDDDYNFKDKFFQHA